MHVQLVSECESEDKALALIHYLTTVEPERKEIMADEREQLTDFVRQNFPGAIVER